MRGTITATLILGILVTAPLAAAQGKTVNVTIEAAEVAGCDVAGGSAYCFTVTDGSLDDLVAGDRVVVELVNAGQLPHNIYVAVGADADGEHTDTPTDAAFANSETVSAGGTVSFEFTVPDGTPSIYLWCDVGDHEQRGMWIEADVAMTVTPGGGNDTMGDGGDGMQGGDAMDDGEAENGIPIPAAIALVAIGLAALRRRD